ncbi:hypothetical protein ACFQS1_29700 [Paractinoplanes rhizophilus]|uniref:UBA domain-containing protein n=1 Tax=Paractinoplanes rhizophilus TaxID=1416877 RepID=A0ABW2HZH4_9ACTN
MSLMLGGLAQLPYLAACAGYGIDTLVRLTDHRTLGGLGIDEGKIVRPGPYDDGYLPGGGAAMATAPSDPVNSTEEPDVIEMSAAEWQEAVTEGLKRVGLSRSELREQAQEKNFTSTEARKLWMMIGDQG